MLHKVKIKTSREKKERNRIQYQGFVKLRERKNDFLPATLRCFISFAVESIEIIMELYGLTKQVLLR